MKVIVTENVIISEWTAEINLHRAKSAYVNRRNEITVQCIMITGHKILPCLTLLKGILEDNMPLFAEVHNHSLIILGNLP